MNTLLEIAFSGFWPFVGILMLLGLFTQSITLIIYRLIAAITIWRHGYPPDHCDVAGNFRYNQDENE